MPQFEINKEGIAELVGAHFGPDPLVAEQRRIDAITSALLGGASPELAAAVLRSDSTGVQTSVGPYTRDDLVATVAGIIRARHARLTASDLFEADTSVPAGAQTWRCYRVNETVDIEVIGRGGNTNTTPDTKISQDYEDFEIEYYLSSYSDNYLDQLVEANMPQRINQRAEKMRVNEQAHARMHNKRAFRGATGGTKMYGMLNNPWIPVSYYTQAVGMGESGDDMLNKVFSAVAAYTAEVLKGHDAQLSPTHLALSPRMRRVLQQKPRSSTSDKTLERYMLDSSSITTIVEVPEFQDAGGTDVDAIVAFRPDAPNSFRRVMVLPFTTLPQRPGANLLTDVTPTVSGFGGLRIDEPLAAHIAYVPFTRPS